ncbi:putative O-acetyltransferase [Candidatus Competibacter denitrificans Run_A_D11]|uniref:O-acetyltransferase n=1 Tax=Candidatus Competibacter denitrificans Run_A_D11 TaxID=1400863 RepID=W6MCB5_9GAMM|nr:acyltransferase [Candidatus Competibacter denitrificans]CDI03960.1 putative O-acetyltransferase [Candidatus Competibacter denitrificans Run_A_D11]
MTEILRRFLKVTVFASAFFLVSPLVLLAWLEKKTSVKEAIFVSLGQFLGLFPGIIGSYLRAAYYWTLLDRCSWEIHVGFGSYFSQRGAELGANIAMGGYCIIGTASIGDGVMIASRVSIPSGKRQHVDDIGRLCSNTTLDRVTIGKKCWIGEGAIILADVGDGCIVSAGTVITTKMPDNYLIGGNPGKPIKELPH